MYWAAGAWKINSKYDFERQRYYTKKKIIGKIITDEYRCKNFQQNIKTESNNILKEWYPMIKWDLLQWMRVVQYPQIIQCNNGIDKVKNKRQIPVDTENLTNFYKFYVILTSIYIKTLQKTGRAGTYQHYEGHVW